MRSSQAFIAVALGIVSGYALWNQGYAPAAVVGVGIAVYVIVRIIFATIGRIRYWYSRGTRGAHYQHCPNCQSERYRVGGDWVLRCHQCGWTAGVPVIRWFTRSVPVNQLRRSISLSRMVSLTVAVLLIWGGVSGGMAGIADTIGLSDDAPNEADETTLSSTTETPSDLDKYGLNRTEVELLVANYTNRERTERGLSRVEYSPKISGPAGRHAQTMANHDFIGHTAPDGETAEERYRGVCDYSGSGYTHGENAAGAWYERQFRAWKTDDLVYLSNESDVARYLVDQWMRSEGHRENILTEGWQEIGVGIAVRDDGKVFATQAFC